MSKAVEFKDLGLDGLVKTLKNSKSFSKVGILGNESRSEGSNAFIGLQHEFGTSKMEMRSFLRMPISEKMKKNLKAAGGLDKEVVKKIISNKDLMDFWVKVGVVAEEVVQEAFDTGGFGKWAATQSENNTGQTLVDTQQLRNSITSEAKEK